jgi:hypothetical protein
LNGALKIFKKIEETIVNIVTLALKIKSEKSQYDDLLIKLLRHPFGTVNSRESHYQVLNAATRLFYA